MRPGALVTQLGMILLVATFALVGCGSSSKPGTPGGSGGGSDAGRDLGGGIDVAGTGGAGGGAGTPGTAGKDGGGGSAPDTGLPVGGTGGTGGSDGGGPIDRPAGSCPPVAIPACDAAPPDPGAAQAWRHAGVRSGPRHRGRDLFVAPGGSQTLIGRFAYGLLDSALTDEEVDIYLLRGCGATWEKLGTALTSMGQHAAVEGIEDNSGRVYFDVPGDKKLAPGRHRVRFVVRGDLSFAEAFIEVAVANTPLFVTDIDGTLTTNENAEFTALLTGTLPDANPKASEALTALAARGYRPVYLTARAEGLIERTREFLKKEGFPAGILHTTNAGLGAMGAAAATYKTGVLASLAAKNLKPRYTFGNTDTDAQAYDKTGISPDHRIFFRFTDAQFKGRRIEGFDELLPEFAALPVACP